MNLMIGGHLDFIAKLAPDVKTDLENYIINELGYDGDEAVESIRDAEKELVEAVNSLIRQWETKYLAEFESTDLFDIPSIDKAMEFILAQLKYMGVNEPVYTTQTKLVFSISPPMVGRIALTSAPN